MADSTRFSCINERSCSRAIIDALKHNRAKWRYVVPTQQHDTIVTNTFLRKVRVWPVLHLYTMHLHSLGMCQYPEISSSLDAIQQENFKTVPCKREKSDVDHSRTCSESTITIILTGEHKKVGENNGAQWQSERVRTALVLKCMTFAQGRSLTSIGPTLHLSIVICMGLVT